MHRIALYGTLRRGGSNNDLLQEHKHRFIGTYNLRGFKMFSGEFFPMAVVGSQIDAPITVDLVDVDDDGLAAMDLLEGVELGVYRREKMHDPKIGEFEIYLWNQNTPEKSRILDWIAFAEEKAQL